MIVKEYIRENYIPSRVALLWDAFDGRELVEVNGLKFVINPLTEQIPATSPQLLQQAADCILQVADVSNVNKIAGEEDKGGVVVAATSLSLGLPFGLARWYPSGLSGQIAVTFDCEYTEGSLFLNGVEKGDRVLIVDDLVSTGGTMVALVKAIRKAGAEIADIVCIAEKIEYGGCARVLKETGIAMKTLVRISVSEDVSRVVDLHPDLTKR